MDIAGDKIKIYANGTEVASESLQGRGIQDTTKSLFIGAKDKNNNFTGDYFDGLMDEFHIYSDALNSSQITELMNTNSVSGLPPSPVILPTNTSIEISALIDGRDRLIVRDGTLQWDHLEGAAVGRHMGQNISTTITTTLDGETVLDNFEWTPDWSSPPPDEIREPQQSSVLTGILPEFPELEQNVVLTPLNVRRYAEVIQQPSEANDYTLIVEFDDSKSGGSDTYTLKLNYYTPEPAMLGMLTLGGLTVLRRRRRR